MAALGECSPSRESFQRHDHRGRLLAIKEESGLRYQQIGRGPEMGPAFSFLGVLAGLDAALERAKAQARGCRASDEVTKAARSGHAATACLRRSQEPV